MVKRAAEWGRDNWHRIVQRRLPREVSWNRNRARKKGAKVLRRPDGRRMVQSDNPETLRKRKLREKAAAQKHLSNFINYSILLGGILKIGVDSSDMQRCLRLGHALLQKNTVEKTVVVLLYDILLRDLTVSAMFLEHSSQPLEWLVAKAKEMHPPNARPSPFWTPYAGICALRAAHALQVEDAFKVAVFFSEHSNKDCGLTKALNKLKQLHRIAKYLSVHIAYVLSTLLNIRWTGNTHRPCAMTSPRVRMMSEVLPLAQLKQDLIKSKVCENAQKLSGRDLCLAFCETVKLLYAVGVVEGHMEDLGVEGLRACLASGPMKLALSAMESAKPIPEEDRRSELCEKNTESAAVDQVFLPPEGGQLPPWYKEVHYCKGADSMAKFLLRSMQNAGYLCKQSLWEIKWTRSSRKHVNERWAKKKRAWNCGSIVFKIHVQNVSTPKLQRPRYSMLKLGEGTGRSAMQDSATGCHHWTVAIHDLSNARMQSMKKRDSPVPSGCSAPSGKPPAWSSSDPTKVT